MRSDDVSANERLHILQKCTTITPSSRATKTSTFVQDTPACICRRKIDLWPTEVGAHVRTRIFAASPGVCIFTFLPRPAVSHPPLGFYLHKSRCGKSTRQEIVSHPKPSRTVASHFAGAERRPLVVRLHEATLLTIWEIPSINERSDGAVRVVAGYIS